MTMLPLEGIRVTDFSQVFAGPAATFWLSVLGAEVIKIENPARPDTIRGLSRGPDGEFIKSKDPRITYFATLNYGKKSLTLNLKDPRAQRICLELVRMSDVVAENFANGVMDRFGLGYNDVKRVKPDIVMLSISGFGHTGPFKDYVAYAGIASAFGGLNSVTGYEGGHPEAIGGGWGDLLSAKFGAFMVMAALEQLQRTGKGAYIDLSMGQVIASLIPEAIMDFTMNQRCQSGRGNRDSGAAVPHNAYPCKGRDSWAVVAATDDEEWRALCGVIGRPEWESDSRFGDAYRRSKHQAEIDEAIAEWTSRLTNQEVMDTLQNAGVPAARSSTIDQLAQDPQLATRDRYVQMPDYRIGVLNDLRLPGLTEGNSAYLPAPKPGEHNEYVLKELLGMTESGICRLEEDDVILRRDMVFE